MLSLEPTLLNRPVGQALRCGILWLPIVDAFPVPGTCPPPAAQAAFQRISPGKGLREECGPCVNSGQRLVHSGQRTAVFPRQQHKVSVSDLPMPDDCCGWHVGIRNIVRPEFVPREGGNGFEQEQCGFRRRLHTGAQVETEKRALRCTFR